MLGFLLSAPVLDGHPAVAHVDGQEHYRPVLFGLSHITIEVYLGAEAFQRSTL
jgi:hypothetical protein